MILVRRIFEKVPYFGPDLLSGRFVLGGLSLADVREVLFARELDDCDAVFHSYLQWVQSDSKV